MPDTPEYAIQKTREFFESLTWEDLKDTAESVGFDGLALGHTINAVGEHLEEKIGLTPDQWAKAMICAGCAILAARKDKSEHVTRNN